MMLNVKILLDPKFYYQKLNELGAKSKQVFSRIGSDVKKVFSAVGSDAKKVFSAVHSGVSGVKVSFSKLAISILRSGGGLALIEKMIQSSFSAFDAYMKKLKAQTTDSIESMGDLAGQYSSFDKQQVDQSNSNKNALSTLSDLQMSDSPLTNVQKEQQRQAIETLRKSYHDLNVEIDAASGKIKNFLDIQSRVLSGDQKKELNNVRRQIEALEKQNGIAADAVQYKGGTFSEYWEQMKETYGWGAAQEAGGVRKQNIDKLMALRRREYHLTHSDRAGDANAMYQAQIKDQQQLAAAQQKQQQKEREALLRQQKQEKEEKAAALKTELREKAQDLKGQAMEKAGLGQEAAREKALRDAERSKGSKLTGEEAAQVRKLSDLTWDLNSLQAPQPGDLSVRTNSLTSRGGFSGGAVMPDSEKIAREACTYNKRQAETADKIMRFLEDLGRN